MRPWQGLRAQTPRLPSSRTGLSCGQGLLISESWIGQTASLNMHVQCQVRFDRCQSPVMHSLGRSGTSGGGWVGWEGLEQPTTPKSVESSSDSSKQATHTTTTRPRGIDKVTVSGVGKFGLLHSFLQLQAQALELRVVAQTQPARALPSTVTSIVTQKAASSKQGEPT